MELEHDARRLLDRVEVLRRPSDLDLLIFFARHPRSMLASEQLAAFLGYGVKEIAASLEVLLGAGFITRTANPTHAARLYVFSVSGTCGGWLPALLNVTSTRQGRLAVIWELRRRMSEGTNGPAARADRDVGDETRPRPVLVPRRTPYEDGREPIVSGDESTAHERRTGTGHGGER